jgi:hypothetical protein
LFAQGETPLPYSESAAYQVHQAIAAYPKVNRKPSSLQRNFQIDVPYVLAAASDLGNIADHQGAPL